ncbi:MAG TPA: extracellular solute-binding protein [Candidatus Competibacteraceae bacterium]|nr:extracellular solute-binding protein [Candidatus Competibacteraceae bacterium]
MKTASSMITRVGLLSLTLAVTTASAECNPDYRGITLDVGTRSRPFIANAIAMAAQGWEKQTCGKINLREFPVDQLYPTYFNALVTGEGKFDVITFGPFWTPDFAPYLADMPAAMRETPSWQDILPVYRERLMMWKGRYVSQTIDGDQHVLYYRLDLFNNPKEQQRFKEQYGYELAPPATWAQYYQIAEFFNRPSTSLWGTAEAYRRGGEQFWYFFTHAAAYTHHPDHPGAMFFDPDTMDAQINNPGWVKALEDYINGLNVAPPGALGFTSEDIHNIFAGGSVAMNFDWGDTGVNAADPKTSLIPGKVGTALLPGSKQVWNDQTRQWDSFPNISRAPFLAFGGWQAAVPANSNQIEAAWNFIAWLSSPEVSGEAVVTPQAGINPYRQSHFDNRERWLQLFTPEEARLYLDAQLESLKSPNVALDLRIPGHFAYTQALEVQLTRALNFEISPQDALNNVAKAWNALTDRFGRDAQRAAYRASMGLDREVN